MNNGSAPQVTRSSTTMPTRSMPTVPYRPSLLAITTLVPTPSVEVASSGRRNVVSLLASNSPAKPPTPPSTSGPVVRAIAPRSSSTARSPAAMSTPARRLLDSSRATVMGLAAAHPRRRFPAGACPVPPPPRSWAWLRRTRGRNLQQVLTPFRLGHRNRVLPVEAGPAELLRRQGGRLGQACQRDVPERVGSDRGPDLLDGQEARGEFGPAGEVDPVEAGP